MRLTEPHYNMCAAICGISTSRTATRPGAFAFDIGDMDGTIYETAGSIEFRPWDPAGIGLAYLFNSADITIADAGSKTDIEWEYKGPVLYLVLGF